MSDPLGNIGEATMEAMMIAMGVPWPDIDEDDISAFGYDLSDFGMAIIRFGYAVDKVLKTLKEQNSADALAQLETHWHDASKNYLVPVGDICSQLNQACQTASIAMYTYKAGLKMELTIELGGIALAVAAATAAGTPLAGALVAAGAREIVQAVLSKAAQTAATELTTALIKPLQDKVNHDLQKVLDDASNNLGDAAYNGVVGFVPAYTLAKAQKDLLISTDTLEKAVYELKGSVDAITTAVSDFKTKFDHKKEFKSKTSTHLPHDSAIRHLVKAAAEIAVEQLAHQVVRLAEKLLEHMTGMVGLFKEAFDEADTTLSKDAKKMVDGPKVQQNPDAWKVSGDVAAQDDKVRRANAGQPSSYEPAGGVNVDPATLKKLNKPPKVDFSDPTPVVTQGYDGPRRRP